MYCVGIARHTAIWLSVALGKFGMRGSVLEELLLHLFLCIQNNKN